MQNQRDSIKSVKMSIVSGIGLNHSQFSNTVIQRNNDNDDDMKSITTSFAHMSIKNKSMEDEASVKSS